ncbi:hypothetical protein KUA19_09555 [Catellatospora sp. NEAU-YM18]|nr:hypothetical protein [Catellatospora tritici]
MREQQRLRMWTLIALVVLVVGALPFYFVLRAATRDPVLTALDALEVPSWAVMSDKTVDNISGSRWCLMECRYRERSLQSQREDAETAKAYEQALTDAGWVRWQVSSCQAEGTGVYSCWRRDEFTLDLWVRPITTEQCTELLRNRPPGGPADPSASPGAEPAPDASPSSSLPAECQGSQVTLKVVNTIADERIGHENEPTGDPEGGTGDEEPEPDASGLPSPTPSAG